MLAAIFCGARRRRRSPAVSVSGIAGAKWPVRISDVLIEPHYRGWRIEVNSVAERDRWKIDVRLLRLFSRDKPRRLREPTMSPTQIATFRNESPPRRP